MKRILLAILGIIVLCSAQAQQAHLTFKGIAIDGQIDSFVEKLKQQGYIMKQVFEDGSVVMEGTFANSPCDVFVLATPNTKTVWKVGIFNKKEYKTWSSILVDFDKIKELYSKKYGKPAHDYHFFSSPYELGDGYEMTALKMEKCNYYTSYDTPAGYITLKMSSSCQIVMSYEDAQNSELKTQESEKEALGDI